MISNRITQLFQNKKEGVLSVYLTAGYPRLTDTPALIQYLQEAGVDLIEIGFPFSDPTADGPTIQHSSKVALENGMNVKILFSQLKNLRKDIHLPLVMMGYLNPVLSFGWNAFIDACISCGIDGLILPDASPEYLQNSGILKKLNEANISFIPLITPQTTDERMERVSSISDGFVYAVASYATTGGTQHSLFQDDKYAQRLQKLRLQKPVLTGFGIHSKESFDEACMYTSGGIIGSAFIRTLETSTPETLQDCVNNFIQSIQGSVVAPLN